MAAEPTDAGREKLLALIAEYGDLKFREGVNSAYGDRPTAAERRQQADAVLARITEVLK